MITVSSQPPLKPETTPRVQPSANISSTVLTPMIREYCSPISERTSMSRPSWSVPSRWAKDQPSSGTGGVKRARMSMAVPSRPASQG